MRLQRRRSARLAAITSTLLLAACLNTQAAATETIAFALTTVDGRSIDLADYRGRWLLVNYWATWCSSCVAEMPMLSKLAEREPQLAVVGLTDEKLTNEALRTFLRAHPVSYPVAVVDRAKLPPRIPATAFGIAMRPISYLISPNGMVVERYVGEVEAKRLEHDMNASSR